MSTAKFSIGDEIWFMANNRPYREQVCSILIKAEPIGDDGKLYEFGLPKIYYRYWDVDCPSDEIRETDCFATKEELKAAVFGKG